MNEIDEYIAKFPPDVQKTLTQIRETIKKAAPEAVESIAYQMPAYKFKGKPLLYFAGYKNHIGLYATPSGHEQFAAELANFKQGKGSVQFPIMGKIPFDLIHRIVTFRLAEISPK